MGAGVESPDAEIFEGDPMLDRIGSLSGGQADSRRLVFAWKRDGAELPPSGGRRLAIVACEQATLDDETEIDPRLGRAKAPRSTEREQ